MQQIDQVTGSNRIRQLQLVKVAVCSYLTCFIVSLFVQFPGCSSRNAKIESRIEYAVAHAEAEVSSLERVAREDGSSRSYAIAMNQQLISALRAIDQDALRVPSIAAAGVSQDNDGQIRLTVFWLEDIPSIEAIELAVGNSTPVRMPLNDYYLKSYKDEARSTVAYCYIAPFSNDSALGTALLQSWGSKSVRVSLVERSKTVAEVNDVIFASDGGKKLDH